MSKEKKYISSNEPFKQLRLSKINPKTGKYYTVRELAREMGDSTYYSRISQIENGYCKPSNADCKRYLDFFNVTYEFLMGKTKNKFAENISINKKLKLTDEAISTIKRLSTYSKTIDIFNELLSEKNGFQFEAILFHLKEYKLLAQQKTLEAHTGERINEARRMYAEKHNIDLKEVDFPLVGENTQERQELYYLLMNISNKSENIETLKAISKIKMMNYANKILSNLEQTD